MNESEHLVIIINGQVLKSWISAEISRDLADISGGFSISFFDEVRAFEAFGGQVPAYVQVQENDPVVIKIGSQTILKGFVTEISLSVESDRISATIGGRDVTGDLVDCAANPEGPYEYRNVDLLTITKTLLQPFGIAVSCDVDVGPPFVLIAIEESSLVMETIEKLARQRGVLVVSDGIGGLKLTRSGKDSMGDGITLPGNVIAASTRISAKDRHSDIWVKGGFISHKRPAKAPLQADEAPKDNDQNEGDPGQNATQNEEQAILGYGHAVDAAVKRYRPIVFQAATQSGGSIEAQNLQGAAGRDTFPTGTGAGLYKNGSRRTQRKTDKARSSDAPWTLQDQAEWRMRTTQAHETTRSYTLFGFFTKNGELWKPNTLVHVSDLFSGTEETLLIGSVRFTESEQGRHTELTVLPPAAYDLEQEGVAHRRVHHHTVLTGQKRKS